jgi:predicted transposase/invertase (TIGR01784 family)
VNPDEVSDNGEMVRGISTEDGTIREGTVKYDIRFMAVVPRSGERIRLIVNIEAQNDFYLGYPIIKRAIYYCARMVSSQYGTEFTDSHYGNIRKVYSIWICMNPPKNRQNTINRYSIQEENLKGDAREKVGDYDLLTAVIICLGDTHGDDDPDVVRLLEVLLSSEREPEEKKKILEDDFSIEMTRSLEREVSVMCNLSKEIEEKGYNKGITQGIVQGILSSIRNLMESMGLSADQAMNALKVPEDERIMYANELNKQ